MTDFANEAVAAKLDEMADMLEQQQADGYRISAYRRAARTIASLEKPIAAIVGESGLQGLVELPGIGRGIGAAIIEIVTTGRWAQLDRLAGTLEPEQLFRTIPGVGPQLAERIHDELHVETLEALELAAHDGRLEQVQGIGTRRVAAIRAVLAQRLGRKRIKGPLELPCRPSSFCSMSTGSTPRGLRPANCEGSRQRGSTRAARRGCRCCTHGGITGNSPCCSRIRKRRTNSARRTTGS